MGSRLFVPVFAAILLLGCGDDSAAKENAAIKVRLATLEAENTRLLADQAEAKEERIKALEKENARLARARAQEDKVLAVVRDKVNAYNALAKDMDRAAAKSRNASAEYDDAFVAYVNSKTEATAAALDRWSQEIQSLKYMIAEGKSDLVGRLRVLEQYPAFRKHYRESSRGGYKAYVPL